MPLRAEVPALPRRPAHPERICWGCERFCPADALYCGQDVVRARHFGEAGYALERLHAGNSPAGARQ